MNKHIYMYMWCIICVYKMIIINYNYWLNKSRWKLSTTDSSAFGIMFNNCAKRPRKNAAQCKNENITVGASASINPLTNLWARVECQLAATKHTEIEEQFN